MKSSKAEIVREYGPFPGTPKVNGVTFDGSQVWFGGGDKMIAFDPDSGRQTRAIDVPAHAGTAFDACPSGLTVRCVSRDHSHSSAPFFHS